MHKKQDMVIETICLTKYKAHLPVVYCLSFWSHCSSKIWPFKKRKNCLMHDKKNLDEPIPRWVEHVLKFFQRKWRSTRAETTARIADPVWLPLTFDYPDTLHSSSWPGSNFSDNIVCGLELFSLSIHYCHCCFHIH